MNYRLWRSSAFLADVNDFGLYCSDYHPAFAEQQFDRLSFALETLISDSPLTWSWFMHTGALYRAYLFRVGERSQFWIVDTVDEDQYQVNLLRLWYASHDPRRFSI